MGFRIHCDACGRFIKTVGIRDIRDMNYSSDEPTHCDKCLKMFGDLQKKIEKLQNRYMRQLEQLSNKAQSDLDKLIAETVPTRVEEEDADTEMS